MDVQDICTRAATSFSSLNLHRYDYGPDAPVGNAVYVYPNHIDYGTSSDTNDLKLVIRFLIASTEVRGGQALLNTLISTDTAGSAVDAIRADNTLGGAIQSCIVVEMRNNGVVTMQDSSRFFSAELLLDAIP
jgi:hypothetical protein